MASTTQAASSLPQGFSLYQPTLGAPLQFFPALGSQELDDMINAFVPGSSPTSEKRATITLDFFEYAQLTGQTFKFYPVHSAPSAAPSPSTASPSLDSVNSSFNVSPITSSWDWSATSVSSATSSSRVSTKSRKGSKAGSQSSRNQATNFSNLPGMKILTKDGIDVTHVASRGTKTKEQRDHAHLMRIIKACDSCRRKKLRCDPSHKKRGAAQAAPQNTQKSAKKAKTVPSEAPPPGLPSTVMDPGLIFSASSDDLDSTFLFTGLEDFDHTSMTHDPFDEFVQFPPMETSNFDFLLDTTTDYTSSQSTSSSSVPSPLKSATTSQESNAPLGGSGHVNPELQARSPNFPFLDSGGSSADYTDFNLYSPSSSFSEDERMLPISSSNSSLPSLNEPLLSECPPPSYGAVANGEVIEWNNPGLSIDEFQFHSVNASVGGSDRSSVRSSDQFNTMSTFGEPRNESYSKKPGSEPLSQVIVCCPPGSTVVVAENRSSGGQLDNVPSNFDSSAASAPIDDRLGASSGASVDQHIANATSSSSVSNRISSVLPAAYIEAPTTASINRHSSESPAELAHQYAPARTSRVHSEPPTAFSDQDHLGAFSSGAALFGPDVLSVCFDSLFIMRAAQLKFLKAQTTNTIRRVSATPQSQSIDDGNLSSAFGQQLLDEPSHTRVCGHMDRDSSTISSSPESYNDERPQSSGPGTSSSRVTGFSSTGALSINERGREVHVISGGRIASVEQINEFPKQGGANDLSNSAGQSPTLLSANLDANKSATADDDVRVSDAVRNASGTAQAYPGVDSISLNTMVQLANAAVAMSTLALYVLAAGVDVANNIPQPKSAPTQTKQPGSLDLSCRDMPRQMSLDQRTTFSSISPLCAI
ncbi:hypothetical protein QQS21_011360 [Conoideocrella luteorostrata]|uniref:Zn(2)-C6 fungal-type domain-containing protein n=1 Tax=Conoideocrella luteorostrata TaxID=1105319 RepID=A0AAJ0CDH0_9HYPO|nr:hypothetical protein QQS21_011360 [Conoideocrella luteorostrata]